MSQARVTRRKPKPGDRILLSPLGTNWTRGKNLRNSARHMEKMVEGVDELAALVAEGQTVGFHALRHTFCTQCFQAEIPIDQVCLMMGHADIKTTWAIYTDWQKLNTKGGSAKLNEFRANARRGG
jgi:integrase